MVIIIKSSINENYLYKELQTIQVPVISLINTSQSLKNFNYPVVTNTHNIQSIFTLMFLLRKNF